jgi:hypothetical protein
MSEIITLPLQDVMIQVDFYDDDEKELLLSYPTAKNITSVIETGVNVPGAEFLAYYLYHRRRHGIVGFGSYAEIKKRISIALTFLDGCIEFRDGCVAAINNSNDSPDSITENIGEAISLVVVGRLHDLHEADWEWIPKHESPTFDYYKNITVASDGVHVVQIEAKGSIVEDTSIKSQSIYDHKSNIKIKKTKIKMLEKNGTYRYPSTIKYGMIGMIGHQGQTRCLLIDPEGIEVGDPKHIRLLNRLQFIFNWISFLGKRSQIAASLGTRLEALRNLKDPFELDNVPLLNGAGKQFDLFRFVLGGRELKMASRLAHIVDGKAYGTIIEMDGGKLFFLGVQEYLYVYATEQDFNQILKYKSGSGSIRKKVRCVIPNGRANQMISLRERKLEKSGGYTRFYANGMLQFSYSGIVFGFVKIEN